VRGERRYAQFTSGLERPPFQFGTGSELLLGWRGGRPAEPVISIFVVINYPFSTPLPEGRQIHLRTEGDGKGQFI